MDHRYALAALLGGSAALLAVAVFVVGASRTLAPADPTTASPSASADADAMALADGYAVWGRTADGTPVRWNPCEPIRWVLAAEHAPDDARRLVTLAMARISAASGLTFEYVGATSQTPRSDRPLTVDTDDGPAWAPVLVSWVPGGSTDLPLSDNERGVAIPVAVEDGGPRTFVTGQVVFNSDKQLLPMFEDRHASWGAVVLHELLHLVGLDHVDDPEQLMHPAPGFGEVVFGGGDRAGLATLGTEGGCVAPPSPQELDVTYSP